MLSYTWYRYCEILVAITVFIDTESRPRLILIYGICQFFEKIHDGILFKPLLKKSELFTGIEFSITCPFFSYKMQEYTIKKARLIPGFLVIPLGLEPRAPTLKVLCSTSWATRSTLKVKKRPLIFGSAKIQFQRLWAKSFCFWIEKIYWHWCW